MGKSLDEAIRATVDEAISSGELLHIPDASRRLAAAHPESGLAAGEIGELLFKAGVDARIPLEWGEDRDYGRPPRDGKG